MIYHTMPDPNDIRRIAVLAREHIPVGHFCWHDIRKLWEFWPSVRNLAWNAEELSELSEHLSRLTPLTV